MNNNVPFNNMRYNLPMFDIKHWYEHELESVGHLAAMKDGTLRRRYATKVVDGMKHLIAAIQERSANSNNTNKKTDLQRMADRIGRAREHVMGEYGIEEDDLSYKWNLGPTPRANNTLGAMGMGAAAGAAAGLAGAAAGLASANLLTEGSMGSSNLYTQAEEEDMEANQLSVEPVEEELNALYNQGTGSVNENNLSTEYLNTFERKYGEQNTSMTTGAPAAVNPFGINLNTGATANRGANTAAMAPAPANITAPSFLNTLLGIGSAAPAPAPANAPALATNLVGGRRRKNRTQRKQRKGRKQRKTRGVAQKRRV